MKNNKKLITMAIAFILAMGAFGLQLFAQQETVPVVGKAGRFHTASVVVGNTLLEQGMYQVQHVTEGENHVLVFRVIDMGFRNNMGNQTLGKEVARVKCTTEPAGKKWKDTKLHFERNSSGQRVVTEVQIAGETVLHKLESQS